MCNFTLRRTYWRYTNGPSDHCCSFEDIPLWTYIVPIFLTLKTIKQDWVKAESRSSPYESDAKLRPRLKKVKFSLRSKVHWKIRFPPLLQSWLVDPDRCLMFASLVSHWSYTANVTEVCVIQKDFQCLQHSLLATLASKNKWILKNYFLF